jgi:hypothetical protein
MKISNRAPKSDNLRRVERLARERADEQARHVPWQRLVMARNDYIDWQQFYLWTRSILEVEEHVPDFLANELNSRCPGFLDSDKKLSHETRGNRSAALRLEGWIDDHMFASAKQGGWFNAITYYAARDPRYQQADVCWSKSIARWKKAKPLRYPSFEEWKEMASRCDATAHLVPAVRDAMASRQRISADRFQEAVSRYIDWEALAYWARRALEVGLPLADEVAKELGERCADFVLSDSGGKNWEQLMAWIADRQFADARREGWFDAILISVRMHPRAVRTMEYSDHCDEIWAPGLPDPYPSFGQWRRDADAYVEPPAADCGFEP